MLMSILEGSDTKTYGKVGTMVVHKVIGYGLGDVRFSDGCCVDGRISGEGYVFHPKRYSMDGFQEFMRADEAYDKLTEQVNLKDCIHFGSNHGENTICLAIPHEIKQWYRKGNPIDTLESKAGTPRTFFLETGVPGYRGWMDSRDGRPVPSSLYHLFQRECDIYKQPSRCEALKYGQESTIAELASDLGFGRMTDAFSFVVPCVPALVRKLATYLNLFSDNGTIMSLRPMIYTYWE